MNKHYSYSFLAIGKTQESTTGNQGFKRYVGLGSTRVLAVNPTKEQMDGLLGYEGKDNPVYIGEDDQGKYVDITFILRTDPETNNGIEITNKAIIRMRPKVVETQDGTKVQVIDQFGNFTYAEKAIADTGGKIENVQKLDTYRKAIVGECALVDFLHKYLNVPDAYNYINGSWVKKEESKAQEGLFKLEKIKDYFTGDVSEIREAIALQPNNKIKLLYGVRTKDDGSQYQSICMAENLMLNNNAGPKGIARLERDLANAKQRGKYSNVEYQVCELHEYTVTPTDLSTAPVADTSSSSDLPWEM